MFRHSNTMNWYIVAFCIALFCIVYYLTKNEQPIIPKSFTQIMEEYRTKYDIPNMEVSLNDTQYAFGEQLFTVWNKPRQPNLSSNALYRIASVSKMVTATAIFYLVANNNLSFDTPFMSILKINTKPLDERMYKITVRDLLRHSGGWDAMIGLPLSENTRSLFPAQSGAIQPFDPQYDALRFLPSITGRNIIEFMMNFRLNFEPGTRYSYSNFGYNILGRIIEDVSGVDYETFVKEHVFKRVGVVDAFIGDENIDAKHPDEVFYYDGNSDVNYVAGATRYKTPDSYGSYVIRVMDAHGGWVMTGGDLQKFAYGLQNGILISKDIMNEMMVVPQYANPQEFYSLGMRVKHFPDGRIALLHSGALTWGTFSSVYCFLGSGNTVFSIISNHLYHDIQSQQEDLNAIVFSL